MGKGWSKGYTKESHPSVRKISETMRRRGIDNFSAWRESARATGLIPKDYAVLPRCCELAELTGVVLGDGNIEKFPRTERLLIFSNARNKGFVRRYATIVEKLFLKSPYVKKVSQSECIRISLYQKEICRRLAIPAGARKDIQIRVPRWILKNSDFVLSYLRGLYEAEGSFCVHKQTCTYKFLFSNRNVSLLNIVYRLMKKVGFHPHRSAYQVQMSRKDEVYEAVRLLRFREYE
jgi:hypothetical protein